LGHHRRNPRRITKLDLTDEAIIIRPKKLNYGNGRKRPGSRGLSLLQDHGRAVPTNNREERDREKTVQKRERKNL